MKRICFFLLLALFACKEVSFPEPQPKGVRALPHVPTKLQGGYLFVDEKGQRDTIMITKNQFFAKSDPKDSYTLSDSLVMKTFKGYYFISKSSGDTWQLRIVQQEKNGDIAYLAMDDENFQNFLLRLSKEIRIDSSDTKKGKVYEIDPTSKQLTDLIDKGYFKKSAGMKKLKAL